MSPILSRENLLIHLDNNKRPLRKIKLAFLQWWRPRHPSRTLAVSQADESSVINVHSRRSRRGRGKIQYLMMVDLCDSESFFFCPAPRAKRSLFSFPPGVSEEWISLPLSPGTQEKKREKIEMKNPKKPCCCCGRWTVLGLIEPTLETVGNGLVNRTECPSPGPGLTHRDTSWDGAQAAVLLWYDWDEWPITAIGFLPLHLQRYKKLFHYTVCLYWSKSTSVIFWLTNC